MLLLFVSGCAPKTPRPTLLETVEPFLPQALPVALEKQRALYTDLLSRRYAPWVEDFNATCEEAAWPVAHYARKAIYGENLRPIPEERFEAWVRNARYEALGRLDRRAVTVRPTALRLFPTHRPIFYDPRKPGEGFPFDYNQNSALKACMPLRVSHLSMDGGWAFVRAPFALGWIPVRDLAYLDEEEADRWMQKDLVVLLADNAPLYGDAQQFLFYAKSATLLPLIGQNDDFYRTLLPDATRLERAWLPKAWSAPMPLPMTPRNIRRVADSLLGEPYTWGGLLQDRDCSATTRDFFMPFGVWLPRNSKAQAAVGRVVDLGGLAPREKERKILDEAVPFQTLLYMPGHIMLYVGEKEGKAYILHNTWGIRTKEGGRILIGKTVVTDLWLGHDLPDADPEALLIRRIESMNIVTER